MGRCNRIIKTFSIILIISLLSAVFAGCGESENVGNAYRSIKSAILSSQELASNSNFELDWDEEARAVIYKSLSNKSYWSDILYDEFLNGSESANGNSPISITVANTKTLKWDTVTSYEQLENNGSIACKKIENGIRVTYFFQKYRIAVPVEYTIREDSISVSIDGNRILEDGTDYKLVSVTLTPNFCSMKNDAENGYLFVPSGCGALMNTAENSKGVRTYSAEVYGDDGARQVPTDFVADESARLPVFGASGNGKALLGIIEEGAGSAVIEAQAGNDRLGYSNVGTTFYVRGYDRFFFTYHGKSQGTTSRVNDNIIKERMTVGYYPLYGNDAGYSGMANKYREYLIANNMLTESSVDESPYSLTFLGGTGITKSILGVPKKEIKALTTFKEAESIISELSQNSSSEPVVRLMGYGDKGIRPGKIAGGSSFLSAYGSKSDLSALLSKHSKTFVDFDIVSFAKSGNGFSLIRDVSKTAIKYKAVHYAITPTRIMDEDNPYYIIARDSLDKAANKALKKSNKYGINSVSLSTLGSIAFSDYSNDNYINKNKIESDVNKIIKNIKKNNKTVAVSNANSYAVANSDVIFDTVSTCGDYSELDKEIPFYQMVYHSYKTMYGESVNTSENLDLCVVRSLAYGMGASFTLTSRYISDSDDLNEYPLYGTVYDDNKNIIGSKIFNSDFQDIYQKISKLKFINYKTLKNGVSVSTYEGGVILYSNLTETKKDSPSGELEPYSFVLGEEGKDEEIKK